MKRSIIILIICLIVICVGIFLYLNNRTVTFVSDEYGFSITYPVRYVRNLKLEGLVDSRNSKNGINLLVQGYKTEKTDKTLNEIMDNYVAMMTIYTTNNTVQTVDKNIISIDGHEVGKITTIIYEEALTQENVTVLISLENCEITVTLSGQPTQIEKNKNEINKIINSIRFL